ncbi:MAG: hypothetical protein GXX83_01580 [Gaiellales bacterium]|nr:hypothetical protein [Gaiellales bacterium]
MRKSLDIRLIAVSLLGALCVALGAVGCGSISSTTLVPTASTTAKPVPATTTTTEVVVLDLLSTFEAKDPFIQQAVSTTKVSTTTTKSGTATTKSGSASSSSSTTSTTGSGSSTSTTTSSLHSMKALSISTTNGVSAATIDVDDVVYQNKRVGDVFNTDWGQVKVTRIDVSAQAVTVLHGSETRVLYVGREIIK